MIRQQTDSEILADLAQTLADAAALASIAARRTAAAIEHAGTGTALAGDVRDAVDAQLDARAAMRDVRDALEASDMIEM